MRPGLGPLAVSCGDPAGIGPEIIAKSWLRRAEDGLHPFFVCAETRVFTELGLCPVIEIDRADAAFDAFDSGLPVLPLGRTDGPFAAGKAGKDTARFAHSSLDKAIDLCLMGHAHALVTGPVSKAALYEIGFRHGGQTEYIGERSGAGADASVMMLAAPSLRVVPVTIHIALRDVPTALTRPLIERTARTVHIALRRDFAIAEPRLAMAGLNPHAGEDGAIGREEIDTIIPSLNMLRNEGVRIDGPVPADSLFHSEARRHYDAILCPTHDQALIPVKALHFDDAVNMTLGLSIIRTSPDHGTAFGIAGTNSANPGSMIAALSMAAEAMKRRRVGGRAR